MNLAEKASEFVMQENNEDSYTVTVFISCGRRCLPTGLLKGKQLKEQENGRFYSEHEIFMTKFLLQKKPEGFSAISHVCY